jgi:sugar phosphate isomerase/epimerase
MVADGIFPAGAPRLSWFPVRLIRPVAEGQITLEQLLAQATAHGFNHIELHHSFVDETTSSLLREHQLGCSQLSCAPDLTNPDAGRRREEARAMRQYIAMARSLGAATVRVTAGMAHPGVSIDQGLEWAAAGLQDLASDASRADIALCLENHYRDRLWNLIDLTAPPEVFLRLYRELEPTQVMVNYDTAQPMVVGGDAIALLREVLPKVCSVHAGDRVRGGVAHSVIGEGDVDFDAVFGLLRAAGYHGFIAVEDGSQEADAGLERGRAYLERAIQRHWGER